MPGSAALNTRLDTAVDAQFGESITLLPYHKTAYMAAYEPDPNRQEIVGVGVVVGRGTFLRSAGNANFVQQRAVADVIVSLQDRYWKGKIIQHDRLRFVDRPDEPLYEISYIEIGMNNRSVLHLLREKS